MKWNKFFSIFFTVMLIVAVALIAYSVYFFRADAKPVTAIGNFVLINETVIDMPSGNDIHQMYMYDKDTKAVYVCLYGNSQISGIVPYMMLNDKNQPTIGIYNEKTKQIEHSEYIP